jgi:hypothetical protein
MRIKGLAGVCLLLLSCLIGMGQGNAKFVHTRLSGYQEVPALSTPASGEFRAKIDPADTQLNYQLEYEGLQGTVTQSHIHLGAAGTTGGIMIWLCGAGASAGPAGTPTCPQSGSVSRTVNAADVVGPSGQGVTAGEFAEALRAIRAGVAYVNVHSSLFPGGEIRGQLREED